MTTTSLKGAAWYYSRAMSLWMTAPAWYWHLCEIQLTWSRASDAVVMLTPRYTVFVINNSPQPRATSRHESFLSWKGLGVLVTIIEKINIVFSLRISLILCAVIITNPNIPLACGVSEPLLKQIHTFEAYFNNGRLFWNLWRCLSSIVIIVGYTLLKCFG